MEAEQRAAAAGVPRAQGAEAEQRAAAAGVPRAQGVEAEQKEREHLLVNQMLIIYVHTCVLIFLLIFCYQILVRSNCYTDLDRYTNCTFDATILLSVHTSN